MSARPVDVEGGARDEIATSTGTTTGGYSVRFRRREFRSP
jgi:hypothetical protein